MFLIIVVLLLTLKGQCSHNYVGCAKLIFSQQQKCPVKSFVKKVCLSKHPSENSDWTKKMPENQWFQTKYVVSVRNLSLYNLVTF